MAGGEGLWPLPSKLANDNFLGYTAFWDILYSTKVWQFKTLTNLMNGSQFIKVYPTNLFFLMLFLWDLRSIHQRFVYDQFVKVFPCQLLHYMVTDIQITHTVIHTWLLFPLIAAVHTRLRKLGKPLTFGHLCNYLLVGMPTSNKE